MGQRTIEEVFRAIAPRRRGIPGPGVVATGITAGGEKGGDVAASFTQAGREITLLRASYQQQADLIAANTQAVAGNTSAHAGSSTAGKVGQAASSLFGGALGILSPVISGLSHLFGGGSSTPAPLPVYKPPPPVSISGILREGSAGSVPGTQGGANSPTPSGSQGIDGTQGGTRTSSPPAGATYAPQITVHVNAMDSQSFMDRSGDIASAVREAMLNNHPINGVVADL